MKIVFSGGGTAGHVTPNLALIDKCPNDEVYYIGTDGMEKDLLTNYVECGKVREYCTIRADKLQRKFTLKNLALPFVLARSVIQAKSHLKRIRPDVIFSKGGYVGLPTVIAGKMLHISTVIHESDMSVGLANKICSKFADEFLTAFDCAKNGKTVGVIVRDEILHGNRQNGIQITGFDGKKPILLVMGGSLGAQALNNAVANNRRLADKFDIFVITGKNKQIDCDFVHQAEFVRQIYDVYAAASVCVTRGGANSLAELTLAQLPFVAVPLTKCSRGEQVNNARWFESRGCGLTLAEDRLDDGLAHAVNAAYLNRAIITAKQKAQADIFGTDKVLAEIKNAAANSRRKRATSPTAH